MTSEFCQQTGFVNKRVQITSRSIQTNIQVFISAIEAKSKVEDFMQGYFFFFRKIVIEVLKGKLST